MDSKSPISRGVRTQPGDTISARRLNQTVDAVTRMNQGITTPQHVVIKPTASGSGGTTAENTIVYANAASTANLTLSGAQTVDGIALTAGMYCLAKNQTTTANRDLYLVKATAWERVGTSAVPTPAVLVLNGTTNGRLFYTLSGTTYSANKAVYG